MRKIALVALLLTLACKKEENAPLPQGAFEPNAAVTASRADGGVTAAQRISSALAPPPAPPPPKAAAPDRMIIRTANVTLIVCETSAAIDTITAAVEQSGGYVSGSTIWRDGEQTRGKLSLRVPNARLSQTLARVRALAVRVDSETIATDDVSQEFVDLGSQLRNLEAAETELRQLMTTIRVNSKKASEVLEIYQQLSSIRGQIEQTRGRMQYLQQMTSYATVNLELVPDAVTKPVVEAGWQPLAIAKDAARALTGLLRQIASAGIWVAIYVVPVLLLIVMALFAAWRVLRGLARFTAAQKV
jgi:hypothetical protein